MQVNPQPFSQQQMVAPGPPTLRPAADPTPPVLLHPIQTQLPKHDFGSPSTDPCSTPRGSPIITSPTDSAIFGTPVTTPRASNPNGSGQNQPPPSPKIIRSPLLHFITNPNPNASPLMKPMSQLTMRSPLASPKGQASPMRLSGASRITSSGITVLESGVKQQHQQQQISEEDIHNNNMNNNNGYYSHSSVKRVAITKSPMSPEDRNDRSGAATTMMTMMMSGKEKEDADHRQEQQQQYYHHHHHQMTSSPGRPCAQRALPFARSTGAYTQHANGETMGGDDNANDGTNNNRNNIFGTYTWSPSRSPSLTLAGTGGGRGATPSSPVAVTEVAGKLNFGANIREPSFSDFLKSDRESSAGLLTMQLTTQKVPCLPPPRLVPSPLKRTVAAAAGPPPPGVRRRLLDSIDSIAVASVGSNPQTSPTQQKQQQQRLPQLGMATTSPVSSPTAAAAREGGSMVVHHPPSSADTPRKRARKGAPHRAPIDGNAERFGATTATTTTITTATPTSSGGDSCGKSDAVSTMDEDGVAAATCR